MAGQPGKARGSGRQPNLMVKATTAMLPQAALSSHLRESVHLHLVLTGPGGGTWDIPVGQSPAPPSAVTIVADEVGFCRLIANRTTPADLDPYITGERASADAVLAAAPGRWHWTEPVRGARGDSGAQGWRISRSPITR